MTRRDTILLSIGAALWLFFVGMMIYEIVRVWRRNRKAAALREQRKRE